MDGILTAHSGFPVNVYIPFDNANTGGGTLGSTERPSLVGNFYPSGFHQSLSQWFDTSAVGVIPYTYGNLGRNTLRQGSFTNTDFSIVKKTRVTESQYFELRGEFFNLFNHPNFGSPDGNYSNPHSARSCQPITRASSKSASSTSFEPRGHGRDGVNRIAL